MTSQTRFALRALPFLLLLATPAPGALAAPVGVDLRVEGASTTIYEGPVTTDGHDVTTASAGTHPCDGTNLGANPSPGPVPTAALDDGARLGKYSWDGDWFDSFEDFIVSRVDEEHATSSQFWGYYVGFKSPTQGGCQLRLTGGEQVLYAFDAFSKSHVLKLTGPSSATTGQAVNVTVVDGQDDSPVAAATVGGTQTGADGVATLSFPDEGVYRLKADRADSIRSNALTLCVDPPGAEPCTSGDRTAPAVTVALPGRFATDTSRSRRIAISWQGVDPQADGSGVASYTAEVRELAAGVRASQAGEWRTLLERSRDTSVRFRGGAGRAYEFRVTAYDRAANASAPATGSVIFPVDDRNRRIVELSRGWRGLRREAAYGGRVLRPRRPGASLRMAFEGRRVALIGRRLRRGGRLRVTLDGRSKVLSLAGAPRFRRVLYVAAARGPGAHTLRLRALGGGPVEIDALAPVP